MALLLIHIRTSGEMGMGQKKGRKFPYGLILRLQSASAHTSSVIPTILYIIPASNVKTQSWLGDNVIIQYLLSTNLNKDKLKKLLKMSLRKLVGSSWDIWHPFFQSSGLLGLVSRFPVLLSYLFSLATQFGATPCSSSANPTSWLFCVLYLE